MSCPTGLPGTFPEVTEPRYPRKWPSLTSHWCLSHGATRTLCLLRKQELTDYALPEAGSGGGVDLLHSVLAAMATLINWGWGRGALLN